MEFSVDMGDEENLEYLSSMSILKVFKKNFDQQLFGSLIWQDSSDLIGSSLAVTADY